VGAIWTIELIIFGMFLGTMLTSMLGRWVLLVRETLRSPTPHPRRMAILVSLFHVGPWILVVFGLFAVFEYSQRWAQLLGVGILVWLIVFAFLLYRMQLRKRDREKGDAA